MLGVFYKYCCCQEAPAGQLGDGEGKDPKGDTSRSKGDSGEKTDEGDRRQQKAGSSSKSEKVRDGKKDGKNKGERKGLFAKKEGSKPAGSSETQPKSIAAKIQAFEKTPDSSDSILRDGTRPKKKKPTSKAFEDFESKGIIIGFGQMPKKPSTSSEPGDGQDWAGGEQDVGDRVMDDVGARGLASPEEPLKSPLSGSERPMAHSNSNSLSRLTDDEGIHTMDEDDDFAAVTRNAEVLKSFRRAPPPKNRSRARRSMRKRFAQHSEFQDLGGFDSPREQEEDLDSAMSRPTPSQSSDSIEIFSGRATPDTTLGDSGAVSSDRDTPDSRGTPDSLPQIRSTSISPIMDFPQLESDAAVAAVHETGSSKHAAALSPGFAGMQQGSKIEAPVVYQRRSVSPRGSPEPSEFLLGIRRMPERLKGRLSPQPDDRATMPAMLQSPVETDSRKEAESGMSHADTRVEHSELRFTPIRTTVTPPKEPAQPRRAHLTVLKSPTTTGPAVDAVSQKPIPSPKGTPSSVQKDASKPRIPLDSHLTSGTAPGYRHSMLYTPFSYAAPSTNTASGDLTGVKADSESLPISVLKKKLIEQTNRRPKSFHADLVMNRPRGQPVHAHAIGSPENTQRTGQSDFFTHNPLSSYDLEVKGTSVPMSSVGAGSEAQKGLLSPRLQGDPPKTISSASPIGGSKSPGIGRTGEHAFSTATASGPQVSGLGRHWTKPRTNSEGDPGGKPPSSRTTMESHGESAQPSLSTSPKASYRFQPEQPRVAQLPLPLCRRLPYKEEMEDMFQNRFDLVSETHSSSPWLRRHSQPVVKFLVDQEPTNV